MERGSKDEGGRGKGMGAVGGSDMKAGRQGEGYMGIRQG